MQNPAALLLSLLAVASGCFSASFFSYLLQSVSQLALKHIHKTPKTREKHFRKVFSSRLLKWILNTLYSLTCFSTLCTLSPCSSQPHPTTASLYSFPPSPSSLFPLCLLLHFCSNVLNKWWSGLSEEDAPSGQDEREAGIIFKAPQGCEFPPCQTLPPPPSALAFSNLAAPWKILPRKPSRHTDLSLFLPLSFWIKLYLHCFPPKFLQRQQKQIKEQQWVIPWTCLYR